MAREYDLIVLLTNPDPVEVAIARDKLEQAGINCQVQNESFGSLYGSGMGRLQRFAEPQLVVFRKDARQAAEVLGMEVPEGVEDEPRKRQKGLKGWLRWIAGLD